MPDELDSPSADEPQLEAPEVTTDNVAADPATDIAPPAATEPISDNTPTFSPQEYEYLRRENAELKRFLEQRVSPQSPPAIPSTPTPPQYEGELAWMKPVDEAVNRALDNRFKTVEQFIAEQKQQAFIDRAERIAYKTEQATTQLADWFVSAKPALKNDKELASQIKEDAIEAVREFNANNPGQELHPSKITAFMDRQLQKYMKAEARVHARVARTATERAKGASVPSVAGGAVKSPGQKPGQLENDTVESGKKLIQQWAARNKK